MTLLRPTTIVLVLLGSLAACASREAPPAPPPGAGSPSGEAAQVGKAGAAPRDGRQIIRTAELSLEADDPPAVQRLAAALVERLGGFVASSEVQRDPTGEGGWSYVTLVVRVPSSRFTAALDELRRLGVRVTREQVAGHDITEEYLDLAARLRTQRALEAQLLALVAQAKSLHDVLEVQKQLAEVRGEVEKLEGRQKLLDQQIDLSTVTLHISRRPPVVEAGLGFGETFRKAGRDFVQVTLGMAHGLIRTIGVLLPLLLFLVAPVLLIARLLWRRRRARLIRSGLPGGPGSSQG